MSIFPPFLTQDWLRSLRFFNKLLDAWVTLPEHLHCVITLPPDDSDFSLRWRLIKSGFSRALPKTEHRSDMRITAGERGI